ncbi:hypothetical protein EDC04DRAFT_1213681 [Pisolithus marmoratus]|nr:hypothetical protein EDC04DRAFT_1213681 [Pisolithus marmoratus]
MMIVCATLLPMRPHCCVSRDAIWTVIMQVVGETETPKMSYNAARVRDELGLGYHRGQGWVHVVYDECFPTQEADGTVDFGGRAYYQMWKARAKHARSMPKRERVFHNDQFTKHAHLPRSIWAARVVWRRWDLDDFKVMVDVEQCPGCCDGPCTWTITDVSTFSPSVHRGL